jgi:hypothetical protein
MARKEREFASMLMRNGSRTNEKMDKIVAALRLDVN